MFLLPRDIYAPIHGAKGASFSFMPRRVSYCPVWVGLTVSKSAARILAYTTWTYPSISTDLAVRRGGYACACGTYAYADHFGNGSA